jgi:hypothetical protein
MRTAPGSSPSSATSWKASPSSTRSPATSRSCPRQDLRQQPLRHAAPTLNQADQAIKAELNHPRAVPEAGRNCWRPSGWNSAPSSTSRCWATGSAPASRTIRATSPAAKPGEPPPTLFEYLPDNASSSSTRATSPMPQIGGMFRGDFRRKATLAEYRLPPAVLHGQPAARFEEWDAMRPQTVHVSATPGPGRWSAPAASSPNRSSAPPA